MLSIIFQIFHLYLMYIENTNDLFDALWKYIIIKKLDMTRDNIFHKKVKAI